MKQAGGTVLLTLLLMAALFLLPLTMLRDENVLREWTEMPKEAETEEIPFTSGAEDSSVMLRVLYGDTVEEMDLGRYLTGVVRAEMPASFEQQALCAQAVAARTYTLYKLQGGSNHEDVGADICTDSTCCQAYCTEETARAGWGADADRNEAKIEQAVVETDGQMILYESKPILAVFHSCSAGLTRRAGEVWQTDLPYLQPVSSPEPIETIPDYYSRIELTPNEFREKVRSAYPQADFSGDIKSWIRDASVDSAGSVVTVKVGGVELRGAAMRSLLGLRSACFEWQEENGNLVFFVTGYGHGVGLSQYGANQMALNGATCREILTHYYTGVEIGTYQQPD